MKTEEEIKIMLEKAIIFEENQICINDDVKNA